MPSRKKLRDLPPPPCCTPGGLFCGQHQFSSPRIRTAWGTPLPLTRCVWCGAPKSLYREPSRKGDAA